jgi:tetratricopeptide (TPR) repeat protein
MTRPTMRFLTLALALAMLALLLGGCAVPQAKGGDYNALFAQHRYSESYDEAAKVGGSMHSLHRDQASLIAGLSARALDRSADATRWLTPIANNADPNIAGQASAALGSIAQEEGRHLDASRLFLTAGSKLKGDDAAHAFMYAGDSLRALNKPADAKAAWEKALTLVVNESDVKVAIGDRLSGGGPKFSPPGSSPGGTGKFTIQTGAFATLQKAQKEASKFASKVTTRTVPIRDKAGRTLYAVQVGRYATKQAAEKARPSYGRTAFVTTAE